MKAGWHEVQPGRWELWLWRGRPKQLKRVRVADKPSGPYVVRQSASMAQTW